jgi:hypothetical protein
MRPIRPRLAGQSSSPQRRPRPKAWTPRPLPMFACTASHSTLANHGGEDAVALSWPPVSRHRLSTHMVAALRVDGGHQHRVRERHHLLANTSVDAGAATREIYILWLGARSRCRRSLASSSHSLPSFLPRRSFVDRSASFLSPSC